MIDNDAFTGVAHANFAAAVPTGGNDNFRIDDHLPGDRITPLTFTGGDPAALAGAGIQGLGSDVAIRPGQWSIPNIGFSDTTFVSASGDGRWVVFGEGSVQPVGRIIMYNATLDAISTAQEVTDLMINASETVRGIGLNYDGTIGVALGTQVATLLQQRSPKVQGITVDHAWWLRRRPPSSACERTVCGQPGRVLSAGHPHGFRRLG